MASQKDLKLVVPLYEPPDGLESDTSDQERPRLPRRRIATVYDAVAGKVSYERGPGSDGNTTSRQPPRTIKHSTKDVPLAPDEVLFRRKDAPERYLEHDIYHAHERDLPHGGQGVLPESDLLKAIHGYTSKFYSAKDREHSISDWSVNQRSMDETALLAFGILLEEAGKEALGRQGDLVFTEGAEDAPGVHGGGDEVAREVDRVVGHQDVRLRGRGPKRRKVASTPDDE
ncbi:Fc.00g102900.m01.CDS01 [Cosmosporella sp. VM-42]